MATKGVTVLKGLRIDEISGVDVGAGKGVSVLVTKRRADPDNNGAETVAKSVYAPGVGEVCEATSFEDLEGMAAMGNSLDLFIASARSIIADEAVADKPAMLTESFNQFVAELGDDDDGAGDGVSKQAPGAYDASGAPEAGAPGRNKRKGTKDMTTEAKPGTVAKSAAEIAAEATAAAATAAAAVTEPTAVEKSLRASIETQNEVISKLSTDNEVREFVSKAASFSALPIAQDALGGILHRVSKGKTTEADYTELTRVLTAANTAVSKSNVFGEMGSAASGAGTGTEATLSPIVKRAQARAAEQKAGK